MQCFQTLSNFLSVAISRASTSQSISIQPNKSQSHLRFEAKMKINRVISDFYLK